MKILTRYKDQNGTTIGYDVRLDDGKVKYFNKVAVINLSSEIDNATLTKTTEFRANNGCRIDTVIKYNRIVKRNELQKVQNSNSNNEFDYYGKDFINICKRIRMYALENRLTVDLNKHKSNNGNNTHLFSLIEACNISVNSFVRAYLYNIQPYSLSRFQGSKVLDKSSIWLSDMGYGTSLVIKINESNKSRPIVVSFHESNLHGSYSVGSKDFSDKPCAVLVDKVEERPNCLGVDFTVQRGFISYQIHSATQHYSNGVALVDYKTIKTALDDTLNTLYRNLVDIYLVDCEDSNITLNSANLSFMSQGFSIANNICLMIDLYSKYTDSKSRGVISDLTINLLSEVPKARLDELKIALKQKYLNSRNKLYLVVSNF